MEVCVCVCVLVKGKEVKQVLSRQQRITQRPCGTQQLALPQTVAGKQIEVRLSSTD